MKIDPVVQEFAAIHGVEKEVDIEILNAMMTGKSYVELEDDIHLTAGYIAERLSKIGRKVRIKNRVGLMGAIYGLSKSMNMEG